MLKKKKVNCWRKLTKSTWSKRREIEQEMKMKITVKILKIKLTSRKWQITELKNQHGSN